MMQKLFVLGIARSGTNLLAGALNAHSQVALALDPLLPFFKSLRHAIGLLSGGNDSIRRKLFEPASAFADGYFSHDSTAVVDAVLAGELDLPIPGDPEDLVGAIVQRTALESRQLAGRLKSLREDNFRALLESIVSEVFENSAKKPVLCGFKEVWAVDFIPLLARAFPQARFVVIRRDPRAIIASLTALSRSDPSQSAHTISYVRHWRKEAAVIQEIKDLPELRNRLLVVRYEDVVCDPEDEFSGICDFLSLRPEEGMLHPVLGSGGSGEANSSYGHLTGISTGSLNRWRSVLSPELVQCIEYHCAADMIAEGYTPSAPLPVPLDDRIRRVVRSADAEIVSWRSDSGHPDEDLAHEEQRWAMLCGHSRDFFSEPEIRFHFLFRSSWQRLIAKFDTRMPLNPINSGNN